MTRLVRYLSHPQVFIDPDCPVPQWGLNDVGRARVQALVGAKTLADTTAIFSSDEVKSLQTAEPLAAALGLAVQIRPDMHENDRSSTGFLAPDVFEETANRFFANPDTSVHGWERAIDAQHRITTAFRNCLGDTTTGDILIVGHGGVGTLLYCALASVPISRAHDQGAGGGGNFFSVAIDRKAPDRPAHGWRPMEALIQTRSS